MAKPRKTTGTRNADLARVRGAERAAAYATPGVTPAMYRGRASTLNPNRKALAARNACRGKVTV